MDVFSTCMSKSRSRRFQTIFGRGIPKALQENDSVVLGSGAITVSGNNETFAGTMKTIITFKSNVVVIP